MKNLLCVCFALMLWCAFASSPEWEDLAVNALNREGAHAYSMPLASAKDALTEQLEFATPYCTSLNGEWRFNWSGNPELRVKDFWKAGFDDTSWFTIDVPSCVELRGFGSPIYTNIRYPHANQWPRILDRGTLKADYNPVSQYRRTFTIPATWKGRDVFLRFDGVYSAYYVWVNGVRVGYAEDSKLPSEFRISSFLKEGANELAVEVYRWCDGSYLEDQDMFRFSGIFRDVSLFAAPKVRLDDFYVTTKPDAGYRDWVLELKTVVKGGTVPVKATLYDATFSKVGTFADRLEVKGAHAWSAEDPYLYTLVMEAGEDVRACRVGFKEVKRVGCTVLFNGQPIKFKGVNRHECSPVNGRSVSLDEMMKDITLFKKFNINTVRTCHYPDDHRWYDLCDRYGIYMVAEANVEGHEPGYGKDGLGSKKEFDQTILERNVRHVLNYRNHPAIFMWSMGNETGHGDGFRQAIQKVHELDATRLVHWERGNADADVDSSMYAPVERFRQNAQTGEKNQKPYFACEYAHAMGNAIGNFQEYWDAIYSSPAMMGGCIWDWVDQALWKETDHLDPQTETRARFLAYGGDYDDEPNDGPFCVNGVVNPQREISAKLVEVGHVHRNLVVEKFDAATGTATLWNRFGFTRADQFSGMWEVIENGHSVTQGVFAVPAVSPLARGTFQVDVSGLKLKKGAEAFINFSFALKKATRWAERGYVVARDQWLVQAGAPSDEGSLAGEQPVVKEDARTVVVKAGGTVATFCRKSGTLAVLTLEGKTVLRDRAPGLVAGPLLTCMRAFTDNDRWLRDGWGVERKGSFYASGLTQLAHHARPLRVDFTSLKPAVKVISTVEVTGSKSAGFTHESDWIFYPDGVIRVNNTVTPHGTMPPALPRLGTSWRLDPSLEQMAYYGRGPRENYIDRKTGSFMGWWQSTVSEQYEAYVRPQDNGYKCDVRTVQFTDRNGAGVAFSASRPLFVQALHYSLNELEHARPRAGERHFYTPLVAQPEVFLNLDVAQLGLGGASCGPKPLEKYMYRAQKEMWTLTIKPLKGKSFFGLF